MVMMAGRGLASPKSIKEKLAAKFGNKYDRRPGGFFFKLAQGKEINVDVVDGGMVRLLRKILSLSHELNRI